MTDTKKIERLKNILSQQLKLYGKYKEKEIKGEVDGSYIYDMAYEWFNDLSRGGFGSILEILAEDSHAQ